MINTNFKITIFSLCSIVLISLTTNCKKEEANAPNVVTSIAKQIEFKEATCEGYIKSDGGAQVEFRGIFWSKNSDPINGDYESAEIGNDTFSVKLTNLTPNTQYYYCAYAANSKGKSFGEIKSFSTKDYIYIEDVEGNKYKTLPIGNQVWMIENLKTTKFNDGTKIETTNPTNLNLEFEINTLYQWSYNGDTNYVNDYGRLYAGFVITDTRKVCPTGWHIPSKEEFETLLNNVVVLNNTGSVSFVGYALKEEGATRWNKNNIGGAKNSSGFTGIGGGVRYPNGSFEELNLEGYWWSTTKKSDFSAVCLELSASGSNAGFRSLGLSCGTSVRCIKD